MFLFFFVYTEPCSPCENRRTRTRAYCASDFGKKIEGQCTRFVVVIISFFICLFVCLLARWYVWCLSETNVIFRNSTKLFYLTLQARWLL